MKQTFSISGMGCSACSAAVEKAVRALDGVEEANVNLLDESMICVFNGVGEDDIIKAVKKAGYGAAVYVEGAKEEVSEEKEKKPLLSRGKTLFISVILLVLLMYVAMGHMIGLPLPQILHSPAVNAVVQLVLTSCVVALNFNFFISGVRAVRHGATMDTLVALGAGVSFIYALYDTVMILTGRNTDPHPHLYFDSAAMILTLVSVGKLLQERAKKKTGKALDALTSLTPAVASVVRDGEIRTVKISALVIGDTVIVRPGERVPADGVITEGSSFVDESALTGESLPREVLEGDRVLSGSINTSGALKLRAEKVGSDTALMQIVRSVKEAGTTKARAARLADKVSGIFVPTVVTVALVTFAVHSLLGAGLSDAIGFAVAVLVVSCPCALGLATPVAITSGMGRCASNGILVKSAEALEDLHMADSFVFDKTGTLTEGKMKVTDAVSTGDTERLKLIASSVESASTHPLAEATVEFCKEGLEATEMGAEPGLGVYATVDGSVCRVGNARFMDKYGIDISKVESDASRLASEGKTVSFVSEGERLLGLIAYEDTPKEGAERLVSRLTSLGAKVVLLTGDGKGAAEAAARRLGITEVISEVLPHEKESVIKRLKDEGRHVVMTGDGINDAPALNAADIGAAIGKGSDIAIDSADLILVGSDAMKLADAYVFSHRVIRNIKQNLFWAFFYNVIGIPIAAGALSGLGIVFSPMLCSLLMSLSSIFVVTNALRLYTGPFAKWKE